MVDHFPLYDSLVSEVNKTHVSLSVKTKTAFVEDIEKIDKYGREIIYSLIRYHQTKNESEVSLKYNGDRTKNDITYDFALFPDKLKKILIIFMKKHIAKMEEDKQRC